MNPTIQSVHLEAHHRILMISDIHGEADYLEELLQQVHYTPDDYLFIVGDMIDKGRYSLRTVRKVMELCQNTRTFVTIGNVDLHRLMQLESTSTFKALMEENHRFWGGSLFEDMMIEMGIPFQEDTDYAYVLREIKRRYAGEIDFLWSLPTIIDTERYVFVHGGLPGHPDRAIQDTSNLLAEAAHSDIWSYLKYDFFYEQGFAYDKYVVVGHWPTLLLNRQYPNMNPFIDTERKIISLDGGSGLKKEGQLNVVIDEDGELRYESYCDFPWITALEAQEASFKSRHFVWVDDDVELLGPLDRTKAFTKVRTADVGEVFDIATKRVYTVRDDGVHAHLNDATNYCLQVNPGDRLQLLDAFDDRVFVKKNGICGWYFGRFSRG